MYKHLDIENAAADDDDDDADDDEKKIPGPKVVLPTALRDLQEREEETKETPVNRDLRKGLTFQEKSRRKRLLHRSLKV